MAKKSMIEREKKRALILERFRAKRLELKKIMLSKDVTDEERWDAQLKMQNLPRNSSATRKQRRCGITGSNSNEM